MENLVVASLNNRWVGWIVLGMMVITTGLFAKSSYDDRQQSDANARIVADLQKVVNCLNGYIVENARVAKIRSAATMKRENAVDKVITSAGKLSARPPKNEQQRVQNQLDYNKIFGDYNETLLEVQADRIENPLPNLPENCDEVPPIPEETK